MKITYAPIVSEVSGRFGGMVFSRWQGVPLARRFVPPAQPRGPAQVSHRNVFRNMTALYQRISQTRILQSWQRRAQGQAGIPRNFFMGTQLAIPATDTDLANYKPFYSLDFLPAIASLTLTPASGSIAVTWTAPSDTPPTGYTLAAYLGYLLQDQDPHDLPFNYAQVAFTTDDSTLTETVTGLESGEPYRVFVAPVYTVANQQGIDAEAIGTVTNNTGTPT